MIVLGLAGPAGSGKSTVAEYLVKHYRFLRFSFSNALYREVTEAFGLEDDFVLRDRELKETPTSQLEISRCKDIGFAGLVLDLLERKRRDSGALTIPDIIMPLSPRQILQWWGTEYRRAQDPNYWIERSYDWLTRTMLSAPYAELRQTLFVNDSVRFRNERDWVNSFGPFGSIWHIHRDNVAPVHAHESETPLPVLPGEREIFNYADLGHLHVAVDQLLSTDVPYIRCEPALLMISSKEQF